MCGLYVCGLCVSGDWLAVWPMPGRYCRSASMCHAARRLRPSRS